MTDKPPMISVGKTLVADPPSAAVRRRFETVARHLDATFVNAGPFGVRRLHGVRVISWPQPKVIGGAVFYSVAPLLAVGLAARRPGSAITCQSPYEAAGVLALRRLAPRRRRPPVVVEVHGDWGSATRLYGSRWRRLLSPAADAVARWSVRGADRVRVIGAFTEDLVREAGWSGPVDQYVTFSEFDAFVADPPTAPPARPSAIFIGSLEPVKAPDVLVAAWKDVHRRLPEARLRLVGGGPMEPVLRRQVDAAGLGDVVELVGRVGQQELVRLIDRSTCLVLPSKSEGLGRVVLEAMARARPVVASRVGGIPEVVEDGVTGRLCAPDDPHALADALIGVLANPADAAAMGRAGRARMEARDPAAEHDAGLERLASWIAAHQC